MKTVLLALTLFGAVPVQAQLPTASPKAAGFDPARLEVMHATVKRFVEEGKHAGLITLLARNGKLVAVAFAQHLPFNQHGFFAKFQTGYYQALK